MNRVVIVDYGMCNLDSVARAVEECGSQPIVTDQPRDLDKGAQIILPGVGAFSDGMRHIVQHSMHEALAEQVLGKGVPFLGICLGMQMLARSGQEGDDTEGLGWIDGEVQRLVPTDENRRIPHMGWNEVHVVGQPPLFHGIPQGSDFFFVHSYHLRCADDTDVLARTPYCGGFVSAIQHDNIFGVQFHPEKSQRLGFAVLRNFLAL